MSVDRIEDLVSRARAAASGLTDAAPEDRKAQLASIAAEFESMLMGQMLSAMRQSAKWGGDSEDGDGLGGQALFEVIDVELVAELSRSGGLGLGRELQRSLERSFAPDGSRPPNPLLPGSPGGGAPLGRVPDSPLPAMVPGRAASVDPAAVARQVTSGFGWRADPLDGHARFHKGIDLAAAYGDDVRAAAPGRVVFSGQQRGYGTTVVIEHAGGARSRYAHLAGADVVEGAVIAAGQTIGRAGSSGRSTAPHVHFEVTVGNEAVDPQAWLRGLTATATPPVPTRLRQDT
ncbi:MAG: peptidoglycan DD-metalloendopeptidase family protein [Vicinamibacterales bacterium]